MNIHPIFVHFPIALLTIYAFMEIFQFKSLRENNTWQAIKTVFLVLGVFTSFLALATGDGAEEAVGQNSLVNMHSNIAALASWFFGILGVFYVIRIINTQTADIKNWFWNTQYVRNVWSIASKVTDRIAEWWPLFIILGIMGVILISIVGALGGAIVYGPEVDPVVSFVYHLFF